MKKQCKKTEQLGMNPGTASYRLVKDLLFKFAVEAGHKCHRCGNELDRESFSVEHKKAWIDSDDPVGLFFELENIAFSHLKCNVGAARRTLSEHGTENRYNKGCRCDCCKKAKAERMSRDYPPEKRREMRRLRLQKDKS